MNCNTAKNISIIQILRKLGHTPFKTKGNDVWYISPFRKESKASFKVSTKLNRWFDHGAGIGGNGIDLIQQLNNYSVTEALVFIKGIKSSFSFQKREVNLMKKNNEKENKITEIRNLQNKILLNYLVSRMIKIEIAKEYCKEVYYSVNHKKYFAISFNNISNGIETRNKYFKGCLGKKDISLFENGANVILVFEGFFDFLSYLSSDLSDNKKNDFLILNSISLIQKTNVILNKYDSIFCFLDNDVSGKLGLKKIKENNDNVIDMSGKYKYFKDVNEWLMNKNIHTVEP